MKKKQEKYNEDLKSLNKEKILEDNMNPELSQLSAAELRERIKKLEELLSIEIKKRESIIEDLKKRNELLLKTALKQSMKNEELKVLFERLKRTDNIKRADKSENKSKNDT